MSQQQTAPKEEKKFEFELSLGVSAIAISYLKVALAKKERSKVYEGKVKKHADQRST